MFDFFRIKRKILLLIPKWLYEDIPNVENSNIVKMLQEKSERVTSNFSEQVLYVDPMITEIRELLFLGEHKRRDCEKENIESLETRDGLPKSLFTSNPIVYLPDLHTGYKPQISNFLPGEQHLSNSNEQDSSTPTQVDSLDLERNMRLKKYPNFGFSVSSMNSLSNTLVLEELSLILNQGECSSPPDLQNSAEGQTSMFLENKSPSDPVLEQTLLPDEFVSCLGIMDEEELPSINSYFPQNILENHINRISFLEK
ncbi:Hypothetical predicted protein [Marmota monax]|uniref:Uncharacterized protein n=1 Tax=Marmota monax TaxID=9995 RepID=A0A5E4BLC4_MARMO|nr:Hypothetical predicted protein [Marmota monax]